MIRNDVRKVEFRRQVVTNNQQHMDKIKEQVSNLVVFNATELDDLNNEYSKIAERIEEGISKMNNSHLYSEKEVKEIQSLATGTLNVRYKAAKNDIVSKKRAEFKF